MVFDPDLQQGGVAADDADRGMLAAQPETPAPLSRLAVRRHDPRWEPGAVLPLAGICAGGGEQSPSLPRLGIFQRLRIPHHQVDLCHRHQEFIRFLNAVERAVRRAR
jgi:hypothetical protein